MAILRLLTLGAFRTDGTDNTAAALATSPPDVVESPRDAAASLAPPLADEAGMEGVVEEDAVA